MKQFFFLISIAALLLTGCTQGFKKAGEGLEYKIISGGGGKKLAYGNYLQMKMVNWYNDGKKDTILGNSQDAPAQINMFDSVSTPKVFYNILRNVHVGDSLIIRISSDSVIKRNPMGQLPPFIKKGHYLYTSVKIMNIFDNGKIADSANQVEMKRMMMRDSLHEVEQVSIDNKKIEDYLAKNNVKTVKAPLGTYVEIIQPGTGTKIDSSVTVKVNYTGQTLDGKKFDSNVDPSFQHTQPYNVSMTVDPASGQGVMKGWTDGLGLLSKGAKARFFIPSALAYGSHGSGALIGKDEILMFDIEILDVLTKEQAAIEQAAERKKMEEMQKHYSDSLKNAAIQDSLKRKNVK